MCVGLGEKVGRSAESHQWLLSVRGCAIGIPQYVTFFQLLAEKHQVVVNHSTAAVPAISAWELGREVETCSCPQEPHRAISEAQ